MKKGAKKKKNDSKEVLTHKKTQKEKSNEEKHEDSLQELLEEESRGSVILGPQNIINFPQPKGNELGEEIFEGEEDSAQKTTLEDEIDEENIVLEQNNGEGISYTPSGETVSQDPVFGSYDSTKSTSYMGSAGGDTYNPGGESAYHGPEQTGAYEELKKNEIRKDETDLRSGAGLESKTKKKGFGL